MWISEWRHSSLAQTGIYFSSMNYQGWARLSVSVISQDFIHLKNLLTHLCIFFFSVCLLCAVITYGVSYDILTNERRRNWRYNSELFIDCSMEYVDPTVNIDGYKSLNWETYITFFPSVIPLLRLSFLLWCFILIKWISQLRPFHMMTAYFGRLLGENLINKWISRPLVPWLILRWSTQCLFSSI